MHRYEVSTMFIQTGGISLVIFKSHMIYARSEVRHDTKFFNAAIFIYFYSVTDSKHKFCFFLRFFLFLHKIPHLIGYY